MIAMSRTKNRSTTDPAASAHLQEGARLAVKLTEILQFHRRQAAPVGPPAFGPVFRRAFPVAFPPEASINAGFRSIPAGS